MKVLLSALAAASMLAPAMQSASAAVIVNETFNSYTSVTGGSNPLDANWNLTVNPGGGTVALGATGLSGSTAIDYAAGTFFGGDTSMVNKTAFSVAALNPGDKIVTAVFFKYESNNNNGNAVPGIGFRTTDNQTMTDPGYLAGRVSGGGVVQFLNDGANVGGSPAQSFTVGNWYYLKFEATKLAAANQFSLFAELRNADSAGNIGTLMTSISNASQTNAAVYGDASAYPGIRNGPHDTGSSKAGIIDNFSLETVAVPEPTSAVALGAVGLLTLLRRK
jgi:phage gpG-like protein